ncbi:hypothetical protein Patl1_02431 [Pistacia atlantica]|uniref:Uncharacterized protein n=1 Tax=Pistacia atlantica TaxID=434234 RepID=A0ACC1C3V0_9ROSI|nr:hypothetical protein Patl1_02431 [Pistacia atlantica]
MGFRKPAVPIPLLCFDLRTGSLGSAGHVLVVSRMYQCTSGMKNGWLIMGVCTRTPMRRRSATIFSRRMWHVSRLSTRANDKSYKLGVNGFADLTNEEFKATRNRFKGHMCSELTKTASFKYENVTAVPPSMDWRKKGAVTPVKDQGTMRMLLGIFSNCDIKGEDEGCNGGLMDDAFEFILQNHGIASETTYPYQGVDGKCSASKEASRAAKIKGYEDVPANSEAALLNGCQCGTELDHGVTAVGYGVSSDGTKYWLVKNSWGTGMGRRRIHYDAKRYCC